MSEPARAEPDPIDLSALPMEERERAWFEHYYRGDDVPQLTLRAVGMGSLLGGVMALSNLYVGLKTGWSLGVAITSCIMSYAIWSAFLRAGLVKEPMTLLENNCMQSTASSAGAATGTTLISCVAAYLVVTGHNPPVWVLLVWVSMLAVLGVAVAVPMKRQMINREMLKFPSGVAAAETLKGLYAHGDAARTKARALFSALAVGGGLKWLTEGQATLAEAGKVPTWAVLPSHLDLPFMIGSRAASVFGLAIPFDPILIAAGAIVGLRTTLSMGLGAVLLYALLGPHLADEGVFAAMKELGAIKSADVSPSNVRAWGLWAGSALMVTSGLTAFAFQWRSIARALGGIGTLFSGAPKVDDPMDRIEVPNSWFVVGVLVSGTALSLLMWHQWGVPLVWGAVSVVFAFVLSLVACRATGETDITPIGAMGKVTQLFYGVVIRGLPVPNLMAAGVTAGAASSAADLLGDLKSGFLLGANPRQQTMAQTLGIFAGTAVIVPAWYLLVPTPDVIFGENARFPAPAAQVWASVAKLLANGFGSLHPSILPAMAVGALLGVLITVAEGFAPPSVRKWIPSPTGLGLAFVIYFTDSFSFLIGALLAHAFARVRPLLAEEFTVPVASGLIAGGSLMGIAIAGLQVALG